jgi:hypothetical protein
MLLLMPAILACIVALLRGGSLLRLAELHMRSTTLIMTSLTIQILIYVPAIRHSSLVLAWAAPIYLVALALALLGMLRNWHLGLPLRLAAVGLTLNMAVILLNGGHMPVNAASLRAVQGNTKIRELQDTHTYGNTRLAGPSSHLVALSDIIPVPLPDGRGNVYSLGDVLISSGVATLVYRTLRGTLASFSHM